MERTPSDAVRVTSLVGSALESVGAAYAVGGSLASSFHGVPRSSHDSDVVAALGLHHVDAFAAALGEAFYADADMMREAVRLGDSFIWTDVLGVLRVGVGRLDLGYVRHWTDQAGVSDLLDRAVDESGIDSKV